VCINVTKVGRGHPKLLMVQRLHWSYQPMKYEMCMTLRAYVLKTVSHMKKVPGTRKHPWPFCSKMQDPL